MEDTRKSAKMYADKAYVIYDQYFLKNTEYAFNHALSLCYTATKYIAKCCNTVKSHENKVMNAKNKMISFNIETEQTRKYSVLGTCLAIGIAGILLKRPSYYLKYMPISFLGLSYILYPNYLNPFHPSMTGKDDYNNLHN